VRQRPVSRRGKTGRRRHESEGGEGSPRGKWEVRFFTSLGYGLPNDGNIWPRAKNDMGSQPREKGKPPRRLLHKRSLRGGFLF
jgi:hypothetical protein